MRRGPFWTSVIIATLIIFGGIAVIKNAQRWEPCHLDKPKESGAEGYIDFDPNWKQWPTTSVPVTVLDFTDEPPMLITPDMAE
jgi:hypothetical protein